MLGRQELKACMAKQGQLGQPSKGKLSASLEDFREKVREPQCIGVRALEWINATEPTVIIA